jgi:hypothetical protein
METKGWFKTFWGSHGDRLVYMCLALLLAGLLHVFGMVEEAKVIYIGCAMLCYHKARGVNGNGNDTTNTNS